MIIFINGSFGVGKTTVAELLVQQLPQSMLFDPEIIGGALGYIVRPVAQFDDFQDLPMWRTLTITTAQQLLQTYQRTLVIPMTIWHRPYFDEVINGLRQFEPELYHFCLQASEETIFARLSKREHTAQARTWINERVGRCVSAFQSPDFALHIDTETRSPEAIVSSILESISPR